MKHRGSTTDYSPSSKCSYHPITRPHRLGWGGRERYVRPRQNRPVDNRDVKRSDAICGFVGLPGARLTSAASLGPIATDASPKKKIAEKHRPLCQGFLPGGELIEGLSHQAGGGAFRGPPTPHRAKSSWWVRGWPEPAPDRQRNRYVIRQDVGPRCS